MRYLCVCVFTVVCVIVVCVCMLLATADQGFMFVLFDCLLFVYSSFWCYVI